MKRIKSSLCIAIITSVFMVSPLIAFAGDVPEVPPPTRVDGSTDTYKTPDPVCVEYKTIEVSYVCGTEEKCQTFADGRTVCIDVEKYCTKEEEVCSKWQ